MTSPEGRFYHETFAVAHLRKSDIGHTVKLSAPDESWTVVGRLRQTSKTLGFEIPWGSYLTPETPVTDLYGYVVLHVGPFVTPELAPTTLITVEYERQELQPVSRETVALPAAPLALETLAVADARRAA